MFKGARMSKRCDIAVEFAFLQRMERELSSIT